MIQVNELRIGNWVNFYHSISGETKPVQIWPEWFCNSADINDTSPIPLTHEILEKAGFKYDEGMESYDLFTSSGLISIATDYSFFIGDNHLECGFAGGNKSLVKYLHQLQNLYFALTGEELQIDL